VQSKRFASQEKFSRAVLDHCRAAQVDLVVMAGFLKRVTIAEDLANRVTNIHPGLIPGFCGHGFYAHHAHRAAIDYGVKLSGCTIHFADNRYDHGPVILQRAVPVVEDDAADTLAARVLEAECVAYPEAIQLIADGRIRVEGRKVHIVSEQT
jgi:folate-dependent phosphoribosylglycinamide formyltransferase PurN